MTLRYLSVCSGIEAATVAWHDLGWVPVAFSEIEKFPSAVLDHHYPAVPNWGDMTKFKEWPDATVDVLVGGTPCQSFSVAGLRKGLADPRGNLMLTFGAIAQRYRPTWLVWENVPGVLSSNGGRDFGTFLGMLGELGHGFAYRVLDAQYFGVPQRRRRVFVVGCLGDWRRAAVVLFERHSMSGDSAPRREAGKESAGRAARSVALRGREGGGTAELGDELQNCLRASSGGGDKPHVLAPLAFGGNNQSGPIEVATARNACASGSGRMDFETETFLVQPAHTLRGEGFDASEDGTGRGTPLVPVAFSCKDYGADAGEVAPTLRSMGHDKSHANAGGQVAIAFNARQDPDHWLDRTGPLDTDGSTQAVAFAENSRAELRLEGGDGSRCGALSTGGGKPGQGVPMIAHTMQVRRLTPTECERLQGFPDGYTMIPWRRGKLDAFITGNECPDGPRYKALGNSMAVPVMRWIGERIAMVEAIK